MYMRKRYTHLSSTPTVQPYGIFQWQRWREKEGVPELSCLANMHEIKEVNYEGIDLKITTSS